MDLIDLDLILGYFSDLPMKQHPLLKDTSGPHFPKSFKRVIQHRKLSQFA